MISKKLLGDLGEDIAEIFLIKEGYSILKRNFRCKLGEIDLIAKNDNKIIFIEVKTRTNLNFGYPEESVNSIKVLKLKKLAVFFIMSGNMPEFDVQFDVISINLSGFELIDNKEYLGNLVEICNNMRSSEIIEKFNLVHIRNAF